MWPSRSTGLKKQSARPSDLAAAQKPMNRPHRRTTTILSCSLDQRDLAFSAPIRARAISISEPALRQLRSEDQSHLALTQESLESNLLSIAVLSPFVAFPGIATVG